MQLNFTAIALEVVFPDYCPLCPCDSYINQAYRFLGSTPIGTCYAGNANSNIGFNGPADTFCHFSGCLLRNSAISSEGVGPNTHEPFLYFIGVGYYRALHSGSTCGPVQHPKHTIYNILSAYGDRYYMDQAFKTAGQLFSVFEDDGIDAIAPYEEGKEIIERLKEDISLQSSLSRSL